MLYYLKVKPQSMDEDEEPAPSFWLGLDRNYLKPFLIKKTALPRYHANETGAGVAYEATEMVEMEDAAEWANSGQVRLQYSFLEKSGDEDSR